MNNDMIVIGNLTLPEIANNPSGYPSEVKAASLEIIKTLESQLKEMKFAISSNVKNEMKAEKASKIFFINAKGENRILTLKAAPKELNTSIKNYEQFIIDSGFGHSQLGDVKFVPKSWSEMKELRKQGGAIQEVIDKIYVDGTPGIEIK